jgi:hypothetical protein
MRYVSLEGRCDMNGTRAAWGHAVMCFLGSACAFFFLYAGIRAQGHSMANIVCGFLVSALLAYGNWASYRSRVAPRYTLILMVDEDDESPSATTGMVVCAHERLRMLPGTRVERTGRKGFVLYVSPHVCSDRFVEVPQWGASRAVVRRLPEQEEDHSA